MEFLIAGILATIAGTAGAINAGIEDDKAVTEADEYQKYLEKLYGIAATSKTEKERQAIEKEEAERLEAETLADQKRVAAEDEAKQAINKANLDFTNQWDEALFKQASTYRKAEAADLQTTVKENDTSFGVNQAIDNLYLSQQADALGWNNAAMQNSASAGNAYVNLASSGIRAGSSISDAVMMESAANASQLQFSQDATRMSQSNSLASVLNGLAGAKTDIYGSRLNTELSRIESERLVNSFNEGGSNWNLYQMDLANAKEKRNLTINDINEQLDLKKAGLLRNKNNTLAEIQSEWDKYMTSYKYEWNKAGKTRGEHSGANKAWHIASALLSGGGTGFSSGYSLGKNLKDDGYFGK